MDMFFRSMIFSIQYDPAEDVSYVTKILNYFNGAEIFTMTGFAALIRELKGQNTSVQPQRIPPASTPVSYTHLDVYKRQVISSLWISM